MNIALPLHHTARLYLLDILLSYYVHTAFHLPSRRFFYFLLSHGRHCWYIHSFYISPSYHYDAFMINALDYVAFKADPIQHSSLIR